MTLTSFATTVLAAAEQTPHPFGRCAWIDEVWEASDLLYTEAMGWASFKTWLAEANRAGLVRLSRLDLVEGFPAEMVRASDLSVGGATFNFLRF